MTFELTKLQVPVGQCVGRGRWDSLDRSGVHDPGSGTLQNKSLLSLGKYRPDVTNLFHPNTNLDPTPSPLPIPYLSIPPPLFD